MGLGDTLRDLLSSSRPATVRVHLLIRGRIGEGWLDIDETLKVPEGMTLNGLIVHCEKRRLPLREALENSPHLRDTLMWNGERSPLETFGERELCDGDELYLLAPIAGG
jgi:molybdopterin converting factor small subunit